ncbi:MAG: TM2 domain-containing membrane protein YozV [Rubritalea sp.]|jgi:TM2 domain-containing membrane protein YozV
MLGLINFAFFLLWGGDLRFMVSLMMRNLLAVVVLVGVCFLSSCVVSKTVEVEKVEQAQRDKLVARVASVNVVANYVLIQRFGRLVIPEDSMLYTLGSNAREDNNTASIKVTGERLGQFLAADITSGTLVVGDAVYLRTFEQ